jgi:hypothetical protein
VIIQNNAVTRDPNSGSAACRLGSSVARGFAAVGEPGTEPLAGMSKVVFSKTLREPLACANT